MIDHQWAFQLDVAASLLREITTPDSPSRTVTTSTFRVHALRDDVIGAVGLIKDAENSIRCSRFFEYLQRGVLPAQIIADSSILDEYFRESNKLATAYKAFYMFMRALLDATYCYVLEDTGNQPGRHSSLADALKPNKKNPVASLLRAHSEDFVTWFNNFRDERNLIKNGIGSGALTEANQLKAVFNLQTFAGSRRVINVGHSEVLDACELACFLASIHRVASTA